MESQRGKKPPAKVLRDAKKSPSRKRVTLLAAARLFRVLRVRVAPRSGRVRAF